MPAAVLWDMDGTLVDTEPYWIAAGTELVLEHGGEWSHEDALAVVGAGLGWSARRMQRRGVPLSEDEIVEQLTDRVWDRIAEFGIPFRPGAIELLMELRDAGIPTALVTMSLRRMALYVADRMGFSGFDVVVGGDDVAHSKPHPEPYLRAASLLAVNPFDCVAIEDSLPGVQSASAAGCYVIGVPLMVPLDDAPADIMWPTLAGKSTADLVAALAAGHGAHRAGTARAMG